MWNLQKGEVVETQNFSGDDFYPCAGNVPEK